MRKKKKKRTKSFNNIVTDSAAVEIHQPQVIRHFEIRFVEEKAGWYADDVRSRGKKELCGERNIITLEDFTVQGPHIYL